MAEVFGFPIANQSKEAKRYRNLRLYPFNNKVPSCTKDKANNPLGVCSIFDGNKPTITCPIRFREDWLIAENAASFFFPPNALWTSLTEVRLNDKYDKTAGNIDMMLVSYDANGKIKDFGALEVQAVYISGNVRNPFERYIENHARLTNLDWSKERNYPNPDYLSSSRKRLAPQLLYKGGILNKWGKKSAVALHSSFFDTLPLLPEILPAQADVAWLIYDLIPNKRTGKFQLAKQRTVYTKFESALAKITVAEAGPVDKFVAHLQEKLDEKLETAPNNRTIAEVPETEP